MDKATQSKEALSKSFLQKKEYSKITIQDIVDNANVSRMAFYRNFNDKSEIIEYYLDKINDDFIANTKIDYNKNTLSEYFSILIKHLVNHKEIGLILVQANLFDYKRAEFDRVLSIKAKNKQEIFNYYFLSGGMCNIYYYWLTNGCKENTEELISIFTNILKQKI